MFRRLAYGISLVASATTPLAAAPDCPTHDGAEILELLEQAPTCEKSAALFQLCSFGATADVGFSEVVVQKCEADFLTKLGKSERRAYDEQQKRCARKYRNQSGTMYRSFEAFCSANLAKGYSRRFAKGSKS